jgi:hypothetical protein
MGVFSSNKAIKNMLMIFGISTLLSCHVAKIKKRSFQASFLVQMTGIEPARRKTLDPKSSASANSATSAYTIS